MEISVHSEEETSVVADKALRLMRHDAPVGRAAVLAVYGDLGAGKTTFVKALAERLGVADEVTSPTYLLIRSYETSDPQFSTLIHIDAYRLEDPRELIHLEWGELIGDSKALIAIEWADKVESLLPSTTKRLTFEHVTAHTRVVRFN